MSYVDVLYHSPLFQDLSVDQLARLVPSPTTVELKAGEYLFAEGQPETDFFIVLSGQIAAQTSTKMPGVYYAAPIVTNIFIPGDVVGISAFVPPYVFASSAIAERASMCVSIEGKPFWERLKTIEPEVGFLIAQRVMTVLSNRLNQTRRALNYVEAHWFSNETSAR